MNSSKLTEGEALNRRIEQLERQIGAMQATGRPLVGVRRRSELTVFGLPLWDVARGPDPERGQLIGHARGILAIGDEALGVIALGGISRGVFAIGGIAIGCFAFGGCSLAMLLALGGLAIGGIAAGGAAVGGVAFGGGAVGYLAVGGGAWGKYVISAAERSPEAVAFFQRILDWFS
jgi:hypothetical protein